MGTANARECGVADRVVLVNGLPASGKSTLGAELAGRLGWVFLSKDVLKESFGELVGPLVPSAQLGGLALDALYSLAGAVEGGVVLDAIWLSTRDQQFLDAGLMTMGEPLVVEVWCDLPEDVARERFQRRMPERHEMHGSWRTGFWQEAGPITENPIRVDTSGPVDVDQLAQLVLAVGPR
jgi:predicted kinase